MLRCAIRAPAHQDLHAGSQHIVRIIHDLRFCSAKLRRCRNPRASMTRSAWCTSPAHLILTGNHALPGDSTHAAGGACPAPDARVVNLVVNALEALPDAGAGVPCRHAACPRITIWSSKSRIRGHAPQHLAHLCDPFYYLPLGGTGLAWPLRRTWHAHGGWR